MPGIQVSGKSGALVARAVMALVEDKLALRGIDASVQVKTLSTGMKVRDEHMRKYIFRTADGEEPDIRFTGDSAACDAAGRAKEFRCAIRGVLRIRGGSQPHEIVLQVKQDSEEVFHAAGDSVVRLSAYSIPLPSQFGVKPSDEVKLHFDFSMRAQAEVRAGGSK